MPEPLVAPVRTIVRAIAEAVVPESGGLDESQWLDVGRIVEEALAVPPSAFST